MDAIDKNRSYTNKDFQSIYLELLELVPKLTAKWDPISSDEADPGVALIKLMAVLGDKLNYNIDKNILENFPLSVTQRGNARQLYDLIGYRMQWYVSSTVSVSLKVIDASVTSKVEVPQYTQLTDERNEISFFTLAYAEIPAGEASIRYKSVPINCMQGIIQDVKINDSTEILLSDLDENFRIYLPAVNIAQNGIFINDTARETSGVWERVDNVDAYPLYSKVYTFVASEEGEQPYIQFPSDIASLLDENTLSIKYAVTSGSEGNVGSGTITNFANDLYMTDAATSKQTIVTDKIKIMQVLKAVNGANPETVEGAYRNSRKVIGTFNTLVTRLDYQNYLRRFKSPLGTPLVSNCVVADRTNDLNYSYKCASLRNFQTKVFIGSRPSQDIIDSSGGKNDLKLGTDILKAYDIIFYGLEPKGDYAAQFEPYTSDEVRSAVEAAIKDAKCVNQDFFMPSHINSANALYSFNNKYALKGSLVLTEKISAEDAEELENKISELLKEYYSAPNVDFGYPIDYELLIERIKDSDSRIKSLALDSPSYQVYKSAGTADNEAGTSLTDMSMLDKIEVVARTITAGNLQLFKFNEYFTKDFGQTEENQINNITNLVTDVKVTLKKDVTHQIKRNEVIQLIRPMWSTREEYTIGCELFLNLKMLPGEEDTKNSREEITTVGKKRCLIAGKPRTLEAGESMVIRYKNSNEVVVTRTLPVPSDKDQTKTIIISSEDIVVNSKGDAEGYTGHTYKIISSGASLQVQAKNQYSLEEAEPYKMTLNRAEKDISLKANIPLILDVGEYFIYTNNSKNELMLLGSGTSITSEKDCILRNEKDLKIDEMQAAEFSEFTWDSTSGKLLIAENEIITLGEGMKVSLNTSAPENTLQLNQLAGMSTDSGGYKSPIFNDWFKLPDQTQIDITDEKGGKMPSYYETDYGDRYLIRIRLNLLTAMDSTTLYPNHTIYYKTTTNVKEFESIAPPSPPVDSKEEIIWNISFNNPAVVLGGINNDYEKDYKDLKDKNKRERLSLYAYTKDPNTAERDAQKLLKFDVDDLANNSGKIELKYNFNFNPLTEDTDLEKLDNRAPVFYFIPIQVAGINAENEGGGASGTYTGPTFHTIRGGVEVPVCSMVDYKQTRGDTRFNKNQNYILFIDTNCSNLIVRNILSKEEVQIGSIFIADAFNDDEVNMLFNPPKGEYSLYKNLRDYFRLYDTVTVGMATKNVYEELINQIHAIALTRTGAGEFNWVNKVADVDKCIQPTSSSQYFNLNHPYNKFTIPQMDLDLYNIKVNSFSIRK